LTGTEKSESVAGMTRRQRIGAVALGLAVTALFWIDPLFIPIVLLGPTVTGVLAALRGLPLAWIAIAWLVAGLGAVVSDFAINHEDVVFHLVLTAFVVGLATAAWAIARRVRPLAESTA
jgi:hypothetical protein